MTDGNTVGKAMSKSSGGAMLKTKLTPSRLFISFLLATFLVVLASAQFRAGIQGTVTDSGGGTVPGATVALTNKETNETQRTTTSDEGFYRFTGLAPGMYSISVEQQGFKKRLVDDVRVEAESLRGQDIVLEAGVISETVTVQAENEILQTEDPNVRKTISTDEVLRLPQVGRDPYELARLAPGVIGTGARTGSGGAVNLPNTTGPGGSNFSIFQTENQVPISANGQRVSANNFQIDGVSVNSQTWGGAAVITPSQESVKEVQVTSSTYSAEDGRNTGAVIKVVSQNGTNDFHGSVFFKYNDPSLNAFSKAPFRERVENRFRQYGGSLGGPIFKDKLFFFFAYEGARNRTNAPYNAWIETPEYRQQVIAARSGGVTAQVLQTPGIEPRVISVIPSTCADANIPAARCQAVGGRLDVGSLAGGLGVYVDSFFPAGIGGGFDTVPDLEFARLENPGRFRGNQYNARVDWVISNNDKVAVSTYITKSSFFGANVSGRSRPIADINSPRTNISIAGSYNRVISATMFNEFRLNMTKWSFDEVKANPDANFSVPRIEIEGYPFDRLRWGADRSEGTPGIFDEKSLDLRDTFNWVIGNHNLKIGGEYRRDMNQNSIIGGARPIFSFISLWNFANDAPLFEGINADPVTGEPSGGERDFISNNYAFFIQDDWKFKPNLTLNFGLRWEYFAPLKDKSGQQSNLILGPDGGLVGARVEPVDKLYKSDWNNFGPQIGFAWSPGMFDEKAVLRGGFGIGYNRVPNALFLNARANPPFLARFGICCGHAGDPFNGGRILYALGASNSPDSFPTSPLFATGLNPATGGPSCCSVEIYGAPEEVPNAQVFRYSLEAQYELPWRLVGTLGYQGSSGRNFIRIVNQNFVNAQTNPSFFATYFATPDVDTNFNALLARLQRRLSNGFQFDINYRFSKSLDNLSYEGPGAVTNQTFPVDNDTEYGPSDYDLRHYWAVSALWDLPFYRRGGSWAAKLLGGWQINGIFTYHTGFPWTPKIGPGIRSLSGDFFGPIRPVRFLGGQPVDNSNDNFLSSGIFPGAFFGGNCGAPPGCNTVFQTYLNSGEANYLNNPPGVGRNVFRGPKFRSLDVSLVKRFRLDGLLGMKEGAGLDLRANFFNILNTLNLDNFGFFDDSTFVDRSQFGKAQRALSGRTVELQVRFNF